MVGEIISHHGWFSLATVFLLVWTVAQLTWVTIQALHNTPRNPVINKRGCAHFLSPQVVPAWNKPSHGSRGLDLHRWILWQEFLWLSWHLLTQEVLAGKPLLPDRIHSFSQQLGFLCHCVSRREVDIKTNKLIWFMTVNLCYNKETFGVYLL